MKLYAQFNKEDGQVRLGITGSNTYFRISLASSADTEQYLEKCEVSSIKYKRRGEAWQAEVIWKSSLWKSKKHYYRFENGRLTHWIEITGKGSVSRLTYFNGTVDGEELACVPGFGSVYVACPNFLDKPYSHPSEFTGISAGNLTELWGSALNTGPLMFAFGERGQNGWIGAGLFAMPGQYGFQTMAFNMKRSDVQDSIIGTQAVTLDYSGDEKVNGKWISPKIELFAGKDEHDCLQSYCRRVYSQGCALRRKALNVKWWREPIFCTWHEQVALGRMEKLTHASRQEMESGGDYFNKVSEKNVRRWLNVFEKKGIRFGTIIIDATWQKDQGSNEADISRFPDMRAFIDELHSRGYRVVLWIDAWSGMIFPKKWCVLREGKPVIADATHPEYREYVRKMVRRMLGSGPDCYNADGLKIDGTNVLPGGKGLRSHKNLYGFEFLHEYLKLMYDASKSVKPDALIDLYGANPYLSDCCDMVRLGDLYTFRGDPVHTMRWRTEVIRAGLPHVVIDTDGALRFSVREDSEELLKEQANLGIPCLYQAEHMIKKRGFVKEKLRKVTEAEYQLIRYTLNSYRKKNGL